MNRPEVRIIETQQEEIKPIEVSSWERDQLLMKYGYSNHMQSEPQFYGPDPTRDLSFQELMEMEDRKYHLEQLKKQQELHNRPQSYTIDNDQVRYNETKWSNLDLNGQDFGIQVSIVSDMKFTR